MECNKEEAERAKQIAESRMQNGDFIGAQKMIQKAQQLFPNLENVSQMLTVCTVHCCAQNKIMGMEMDWYGILQIDKSADDGTIKKQYRKLALLLHPDKNKFFGAETAFKLIGEANRVLSDKMQRSLYDVRCRTVVRPLVSKSQPQPSQRNSIAKKQGASTAVPKAHNTQFAAGVPQNAQGSTFWTGCSSCGTRYQYHTNHVNKVLLCQHCRQAFTAFDLGTKGIPPRFPGSKVPNRTGVPNPAAQNKGSNPAAPNGVPNQGPSKAPLHNNGEIPFGLRVHDNSVKVNPVSNVRNGDKVGGGSKAEKKGVDSEETMKPNVISGVEHSKKMKPGVANGRVNVGVSKLSTNDSRRKRKPIDEYSDEDDDMEVEENGGNLAGQNVEFGTSSERRRSSRQKQNVSYKEDIRDAVDDDDFVIPPKRSKGSKLSNANGEKVKEEDVSVGSFKDNKLSEGILPDKTKLNGKTDGRVEETLPDEKCISQKCREKGKEAEIIDSVDKKLYQNEDIQSDSDAAADVNPEILEYPDPEFSDFDIDKAEGCFAVNQVWAIYDKCDGMPRYYARVKKVLSPGFKLRITWLEPDPDEESEIKWCDADLPISCGKFMNGSTEVTHDHLMFSHQTICVNGSNRQSFLIYPRKGETWAVFRDWDMEWSSDPEKHEPPYQYDFVEVLTDYSEEDGIGVSYLGKVKGFVSLFQKTARDGIFSFQVSPSEMYRFSHRVPSFKMTGKEREGVPVGSFELDPASLPPNLNEISEHGDVKKGKESSDGEPNVGGKSPNSKAEGFVGLKRNCTPKKSESDIERENVILRRSPRKSNTQSEQAESSQCSYGNHTSDVTKGSQNEAKGNSTDIKPKNPKKNKKDDSAVDTLKFRRSQMDSSQ